MAEAAALARGRRGRGDVAGPARSIDDVIDNHDKLALGLPAEAPA